MRKLVIGILAHVDAGKTTLSEALLYLCKRIRKQGRVDHGDAYLDTFELERERGITIFSKQAELSMGEWEVTLLDTPGHVDFSAEMERTLQILDCAILVISGADGVQGHTLTLWRLLKRYGIPVFLFINKMDQEGTDRDALHKELKKRLSDACLDFEPSQEKDHFWEELAMCDERLLERYLEEGEVPEEEISRLVRERKVFPCYFGSALKLTGVQELIDGLVAYASPGVYGEAFGAKIFKIARDEQGNRLTYMKITGGRLRVKELLTNQKRFPVSSSEEVWEEKVDQIRLYSGARYQLLGEAPAGTVCAVTGLTHTRPGQGLGMEAESEMPVLEPVLKYQVCLPPDCDVHQMLKRLKELEEEEPQLHIAWDPAAGEIHAMVMGEVQTEILKSLIWERFHTAVEFGRGSIVYKETIAAPVEGVGHFEPLRHYAEVHLLLEPGERGSGLQFFTACSEDVLDKNWQRLILTHLEEKEHLGVLTGSALTDVQITLLTGRARLKHTEGGDFRQATYRAVRQGLKKARSILLEPYYEFRMELPAQCVGRAMADIQRMQGTLQEPYLEEEGMILKGTVPVSAMGDYQSQFIAYTGGQGRLFCTLGGYQPCQDQDEVVRAIGYDPERDLDNPTGSVFCAHGAGFVVPWYEVEQYMHLESAGNLGEPSPEEEIQAKPSGRRESHAVGSYEEEKELMAIFERTFGPVKREREPEGARVLASGGDSRSHAPKKKEQEEYLLVDGYNVIFAWEELRLLAESDLHGAASRLMDILSDYQGYKGCTLILVFDAYKVEGHQEEVVRYHNIHVVYTREAETADQYIEKTVHRLGRQYKVTVATSDGLEQVIIMGQGAHRISAKGLQKEILETKEAVRQEWHVRRQSSRSYLFDQASPEISEYVEDVRLGKKKF
ncbi:MAG: TetM/TetW/TetO/TetS family tetracycline resistance ribosomal protection protein [Eubacteriales bacterium]|nr:TetM/TetW/TetO/TetS family tetracycline resistance ribosomal protection protein [Eubacteriales bacterium]